MKKNTNITVVGFSEFSTRCICIFAYAFVCVIRIKNLQKRGNCLKKADKNKLKMLTYFLSLTFEHMKKRGCSFDVFLPHAYCIPPNQGFLLDNGKRALLFYRLLPLYMKKIDITKVNRKMVQNNGEITKTSTPTPMVFAVV